MIPFPIRLACKVFLLFIYFSVGVVVGTILRVL